MSGEGGIRTHDRVASIVVFKTTALVHYATSPEAVSQTCQPSLTRRRRWDSNPREPYRARGFSKPVQWTSYATPPNLRQHILPEQNTLPKRNCHCPDISGT